MNSISKLPTSKGLLYCQNQKGASGTYASIISGFYIYVNLYNQNLHIKCIFKPILYRKTQNDKLKVKIAPYIKQKNYHKQTHNIIYRTIKNCLRVKYPIKKTPPTFPIDPKHLGWLSD